MQWLVKIYNVNTNKIENYDVFKNEEKTIKALKKSCTDKKEFKESFRRHLMWRYWSRCEYELMLSSENSKVYLYPWISKDPEAAKIDVTYENNENGFSWPAFTLKHLKLNDIADEDLNKEKYAVKIDVFDQLDFMMDSFIDCCWKHHFAYERKHKKFEEQ